MKPILSFKVLQTQLQSIRRSQAKSVPTLASISRSLLLPKPSHAQIFTSKRSPALPWQSSLSLKRHTVLSPASLLLSRYVKPFSRHTSSRRDSSSAEDTSARLSTQEKRKTSTPSDENPSSVSRQGVAIYLDYDQSPGLDAPKVNAASVSQSKSTGSSNGSKNEGSATATTSPSPSQSIDPLPLSQAAITLPHESRPLEPLSRPPIDISPSSSPPSSTPVSLSLDLPITPPAAVNPSPNPLSNMGSEPRELKGVQFYSSYPTETADRDVAENLFKAYAKRDASTGQLVVDAHQLGVLLKVLGEHPSQERLQKMIEAADADRNGVMDLQEFLSACNDLTTDSYVLEEIERRFLVLDADFDGYLSIKDLEGLLSTLGDKLSRAEVESIIKAADKDNDSRLSFSEFCDLLTQGSKSWRIRSTYRVIFVTGAPQSGKSTFCTKFVERTGSLHVSAGDLLKREVEQGTELGKEVQKVLSTGGIVKGSLMLALLKKYLAENSGRYLLLDGFLRSKENAAEFEATCGQAEMVLLFESPDDVSIGTLVRQAIDSGDPVYQQQGAEIPGIDSTKKKVVSYYRNIIPALQYFESKGIPIRRVDNSGTPEEVFEKMIKSTPLARLLLKKELPSSTPQPNGGAAGKASPPMSNTQTTPAQSGSAPDR